MKTFPLFVTSLAMLAALTGCSASRETAVTMNDVPPAVRETLARESAGGQVTEIEREMKNGRVVYSADATVNGVAWDICVAEDGSLLTKEKE